METQFLMCFRIFGTFCVPGNKIRQKVDPWTDFWQNFWELMEKNLKMCSHGRDFRPHGNTLKIEFPRKSKAKKKEVSAVTTT